MRRVNLGHAMIDHHNRILQYTVNEMMGVTSMTVDIGETAGRSSSTINPEKL